MSGVPRLYRSSGQSGHSPELIEHPNRIYARKLEREVRVRFVDAPCSIATAEGAVRAQPGDAVITGIAGEHWRVSRRHFADKYRPAGGTEPGRDGTYLSLRNRVLAIRMQEPFEVLLADGVSCLRGRPGDWLIDYGDGSLGIVSEAVFRVTYEIVD